jgi:hypothetical protein
MSPFIGSGKAGHAMTDGGVHTGGNLRAARKLYARWVAQAPAPDIVMGLRTLSNEDGSPSRLSSTELCQCLYSDLYRRVGQRNDASYIRIYAESGEEPPDFVWMDEFSEPHAKPVKRIRLSRRGRRQLASGSRNIRGFRHHAVAERLVCEAVRRTAEHDRTYAKKEAPPVFAETSGIRRLFSVAEASVIYRQAELKFGRENQAYVELVIRDLLKQGNRRGLAKAPSTDGLRQLSWPVDDNYLGR